MLTLRFGELDEPVRGAIAAASTEQIDLWAARLVDGTLTLEDITA